MLGPTNVTRAPSFEQTENVRACDATEQNIPDDRHVQAGDFTSAFADGVEIEKRLGRMFVRAVAGVDHARF